MIWAVWGLGLVVSATAAVVWYVWFLGMWNALLLTAAFFPFLMVGFVLPRLLWWLGNR